MVGLLAGTAFVHYSLDCMPAMLCMVADILAGIGSANVATLRGLADDLLLELFYSLLQLPDSYYTLSALKNVCLARLSLVFSSSALLKRL